VISPTLGFLGSLVLTLACLGCAVVTGMKARRRAHLSFVAGAVLMLGTTIFFALELGKLYDLESAGWITPVHMSMARLNTAAYLLPLVTGILTIRNPKFRGLHSRAAWSVLVFTVCTAVTGTVMLLLSDPIEA
jgi:hypothetical protein